MAQVATEAMMNRNEKVIDRLLGIADIEERARQASALVEHFSRMATNAGDIRADCLIEMREAGRSYGDIASVIGLSRARASQLVQKQLLMEL
jgi:hypothetical protein